MSFSNYLENLVLDHILGTTLLLQPALYMGLANNVTDISTGSDCGEVSGSETGYERIPVSGVYWMHALSGHLDNYLAIEFPEAIASWGMVTHFILVSSDVVGTGSLYMYGVLANPCEIEEGSLPRFDSGSIVATLD